MLTGFLWRKSHRRQIFLRFKNRSHIMRVRSTWKMSQTICAFQNVNHLKAQGYQRSRQENWGNLKKQVIFKGNHLQPAGVGHQIVGTKIRKCSRTHYANIANQGYYKLEKEKCKMVQKLQKTCQKICHQVAIGKVDQIDFCKVRGCPLQNYL